MKVIGTAGHIDHGKSTLVKRLTGTDPDTLGEEQRRGMTIDLGFAWFTLPSGIEASIVDVPGHERFIRNMLAGVGGINVAMLVVASDEGIMPQTREHLAVLDLLNVQVGIVVLTKTDLVDEDWLELVQTDVSEKLTGTSLAGSEIISVSARTDKGIDNLIAGLDRALHRVPERATGRTPYLPVDRVFSVAGFGTVVTGTLQDGEFRVGQEVEVLPGGKRARIRGLQSHRRDIDTAYASSRVAVNLAPLTRTDVVRGHTLTMPGEVRSTRRFDARLRVLADAPFRLTHGLHVSLHVGAGEYGATLRILQHQQLAPGTSGWVQIRTDDQVALVRGQRFILRLPAPARTVAGGEVIDVLPQHRRPDLNVIGRLHGLASDDGQVRVLAALSDGRARDARQVAELVGIPIDATRRLLESTQQDGTVVVRGQTYLSAAAWESLAARVETTLEDFHDRNPLRRGMPREELRRRLGVRRQDWSSTIVLLANSGVALERGPLLARPNRRVGTEGREAEVERVIVALQAEPYSPPDGDELLARAHTETGLLSVLAEEGTIVGVAEGLYFERKAYDRMVATTLDLIARNGSVTVAQFRDAFATSRKYALRLLEHLDAERITRRQGDERIRGSNR